MSTIEIRKRLFDYIRDADDLKVQAIYKMIENQVQTREDIWTDAFTEEMESRVTEFEETKMAGIRWDDVKNRAEKLIKSV